MILLIFLILGVSSEETYQNSSNICQKCTCQDARIFTIDCSDQKLFYMLANWPSQKQIKAIFSGNNFTNLEKVPPTDATVEIVLSNCQIRSLDPAVFDTATNTKFVDLSHNFLTSEELTKEKFRGVYQNGKGQPIAVENLDLSYNQIHSLNKNVFEFLPNLTRLNLEGNDFKLLDIHTQLALSKATNLVSLNLADNELTELVPGAVENLKKLVEIDLSTNSLDFVPESLGVVGGTLEVLLVDNNPIFEISAETFAGVPNLIHISANNLTKLKQIDSGAFSTTLKLTTLRLSNNTFLQEINSTAFSPNSTIQELYLNNNNLRSIPVDLLSWRSLHILELRNNPLHCNCDLYHIASALSRDITRNEDGPTCLDPWSGVLVQVYKLTEKICEIRASPRLGKGLSHRHFSIPLAGLFVTLAVALSAAMVMAYQRYRRFMPQRNDSFVSQVIYSPLLNARS